MQLHAQRPPPQVAGLLLPLLLLLLPLLLLLLAEAPGSHAADCSPRKGLPHCQLLYPSYALHWRVAPDNKTVRFGLAVDGQPGWIGACGRTGHASQCACCTSCCRGCQCACCTSCCRGCLQLAGAQQQGLALPGPHAGRLLISRLDIITV
jgi:hypothetical protein